MYDRVQQTHTNQLTIQPGGTRYLRKTICGGWILNSDHQSERRRGKNMKPCIFLSMSCSCALVSSGANGSHHLCICSSAEMHNCFSQWQDQVTVSETHTPPPFHWMIYGCNVAVSFLLVSHFDLHILVTIKQYLIIHGSFLLVFRLTRAHASPCTHPNSSKPTWVPQCPFYVRSHTYVYFGKFSWS